MKNILISEFKKLKFFSLIILTLGLLYQICLSIYINESSNIAHNLEIWKFSNEYFNFLLPLISSFPFWIITISELNNGYIKYVNNRVSIKKYLAIKYFATILVSATVIFLIYFFGLIFSMYFIEIKNVTLDSSFSTCFLGEYQEKFPILYGVVFSIWKGIISALMCSLSFGIALVTKNAFIILTGPFIYSIIENFFWDSLSMPYYSLTTSIDPNRLMPEVISFSRLLTGPTIYFILFLILVYIGTRRGIYD